MKMILEGHWGVSSKSLISNETIFFQTLSTENESKTQVTGVDQKV